MLIPLLIACGEQGDAVAWALQHATVTSTEDSLTGYQVWEFFSSRWEQSRDEKHHVCSLVQALSGEPAAVLSGCPGCTASFAITAVLLESDCDDGITADPDFAALTHFAFGAVPAELDSLDPYAGQSLGWFVSWDGQEVEPQGFAWASVIESGEESSAEITSGEPFTLWPATAWEL